MSSLRLLSRNLLLFLLSLLVVAAGAQTGASRAGIAGVVKDPTGAIIPGASVKLLRSDGSVVATVMTDGAGRFQLAAPADGVYALQVERSGFSTQSQTVKIPGTAVSRMTVTLPLASVADTVTVNADESVPVGDAANNQDAAMVSADEMKTLPIFDADIVASLSAFLDAGATGEGGATLVVDGVESKTVGVSPSAVERVSINQDPYSAQYRQPGRGQVEIITKSAADTFHGSFSFTFRDSVMNAKNYFATTKPSEQRRIYEGYLTGPVKFLPKSSFLFSLTRKEEDTDNEVIAATIPVPMPEMNVPAPTRSTAFTLKVARQYNDHHSGYVLYRFFDAANVNQNVGGQTQASAGYTQNNFDMDITYHDDFTVSTNKLNQFNILFERNLDSTISTNPGAPQVNVEGVGTFGSSQQDQYNTENNPNVSDIFTWTLKTKMPQELKFGIQLPNDGRRILEDKTDRQGTYTFASTAAFAAGAPSSFSIQQGPEKFETIFSQPSAFFLDTIQVTPKLTVIPGVRYDFQNTLPNTKDAVEPHLSLAYVLDKDHGLVVRTGGAVYVRRVGVNIGQQIARYENATERNLLVTANLANLCYPTTQYVAPPLGGCTVPLSAEPPSLYVYAPGMQSPAQAYFGLSVERQLNKRSTLTIGYDGFRGWHALRSIDINAPLPPFTSYARPNPNYAQVDQLNSGGYQKQDGLSVSYRGRFGSVFTGFLQYSYMHADANTLYSGFFPQNQFLPNAEWSRADYDQRHRLSFFGTLMPDKPVTLGIGFYNYTGTPYTETTGNDDYKTGLFNARPAGVARNTLDSGLYQDLQLRLGYTHKLRALKKDEQKALAFSISSFNTLNRVNFTNYVGVVSSPEFKQPTQATSPRRLQLSASYSF